MKIFADGSNYEEILSLYENRSVNKVAGFTTNPSLMKKDGVKNYLDFARNLLSVVKDVPVSFEVISDDFDEMERQAKILSNLGDNVFVKIPIVNSLGLPSYKTIKNLSENDIKLNITAVFTKKQVLNINKIIECCDTDHIISIFAGRIADTGRDPSEIVKYASRRCKPNIQILWASTREVYNIYQAEKLGCDIITVTSDILEKYNKLRGYDLDQFCLDTVNMFNKDAISAGYTI